MKKILILLGLIVLIRCLGLIFNPDPQWLVRLLSRLPVFIPLTMIIPSLWIIQRYLRNRISPLLIYCAILPVFVGISYVIKTPLSVATGTALWICFILNTLPDSVIKILTIDIKRTLGMGLLLIALYPSPELICPVILAQIGCSLIGNERLTRLVIPAIKFFAIAILIPAHAAIATFWSYKTPPQPDAFPIQPGSYYQLEIDEAHDYLFAANHTKSSIDRFDLWNTAMKPARITFPNGVVQHFEFNPNKNSLLFFNIKESALYEIHGLDMKQLSRNVYESNLRIGSAIIAYDSITEHVYIGFELNPLWIISLTTKELVKTYDLLGNKMEGMVPDIARRRMFITYYKKNKFISSFNLDTAEPLATIPLPGPGAVPVIDKTLDLLFVPLPSLSLVMSFDLNTMKPAKEYHVAFGARTVGTDGQHGILFVASVIDGTLQAFDIQSGNELKRWKVGLWSRFIAVDSKHQKLYVSSGNEGLWEVDYSSLLK